MRLRFFPLCSASVMLCLLAAPLARADERADDLLKEVERATKSVSSLSAKLQVTLTTQNLGGRPGQSPSNQQSASGFSQGNEPLSFTYTGTVKLQRPNLERIELADPVHQTIACDGTSRWTLLSTHEYIKNPADPDGKSPGSYGPVLMFFAPETARTAGVFVAPGSNGSDPFVTRYLGRERGVPKAVQGQQRATGAQVGREGLEEFDVVEVRQSGPTPLVMKIYINADKMVMRVVSETRRSGVSTIQDVSLLSLKLGQKFDPAEFAFELPADARPYVFKPSPPRN